MRRNPNTPAQLLQLLQRWASSLEGEEHRGAKDLIEQCQEDPAFLQAFTDSVNAIMERRAATKAADKAEAKAEAVGAPAAPAPSSGTGPLTDKEAWLMLADLVDTALTDLTAEERSALKAAFRAEAAKS